MSRCKVVGIDRPQVWKDDHGWNCTQSTECLTCHMVNSDRLAEDATWDEAMRSSIEARPVANEPTRSTP